MRAQAPDPPNHCPGPGPIACNPCILRRSRLRARLAARLPPQSNGVGCVFHPRAVASSHSMISSGVCGCCPSNARLFIILWNDSAMLSHDPDSGVYKGSTPRWNIHTSKSGVVWPTRLSITSSILRGASHDPEGHQRVMKMRGWRAPCCAIFQTL